MASFADLQANLRLNITDFARNLNNAAAQVKRFGKDISGRPSDAMEELNKNTSAWGLNLKSVSRVVSGILIAQGFYNTLQSIRACTDATWEFTQQLENAQLAYSSFFNSSSLAAEYINVMKDYAAQTPIDFSSAEAASRRLSAYGIQSKNLMYVMQGIMSTATAQGDPSKVEPLSRAIGQIYTYGKLMTAEVRQLSEAGVPAFEILADKLNLTQEQLRNLGNEAIPASKAINALIDGMTERFGGLTKAATYTITGLVNNIKDNAVMLAAGLSTPITRQVKAILAIVGEGLFGLRDAYEASGIGGVFEKLFPESLHAQLRQFAASFLVLMQAIGRFIGSVLTGLQPVLGALITMFNAVAPIIATVINALSWLVNVITSNSTAMKILAATLAAAATMWVLFKVKAIAALAVASVVTLISKAIAALSAVMTLVVAHPFWTLLIGITGIVVGLSTGFGGLSDKISGMFKSLNKFNGIDPDKLLLPSQKERANDLEKFNQKLDGTSDAMDDLADSTGKATKAAKGLLSFDEVFKLNQPDEGTDNGIETDTDFGEIPSFDFNAEDLIPDIPDFTGFADNFVGKLLDKLKERLLSAGIGAIIGGALGGILGGPLGAKIGAIAGAIAGWFWKDLAEALNLTDAGKVAIPIAAGLGAILGGLIGGPFGATIGAGIGLLAGSLIDAIVHGVETGDWSRLSNVLGVGLGAALGYVVGGPLGAAIFGLAGLLVSKIAEALGLTDAGLVAAPIATMLGAAIGYVVGGPPGAIIGMAIGGLVTWLIDSIALGLETGDWSGVGYPIAIGLGAAIGFAVGGPGGAAIGAAIGGVIGWIIDDGFATGDWNFTGLSSIMGTGIGAAIGMLVGSVGGPIGAGIGLLVGYIVGSIIDLMEEADWDWSTIAEAFKLWGQDIGNAFLDGMFSDGGIFGWSTKLFEAAGEFFNDAWGAFTEGDWLGVGANILNGILTGLAGAITLIFEPIARVFTAIFNAICAVFGINSPATTMMPVGANILLGLLEGIVGILGEVLSGIAEVCGTILMSVVGWLGDIGSGIAGFVGTAVTTIGGWVVDLGSTVGGAMVTFGTTVAEGFSAGYEAVSGFASDAISTIGGWVSDLGSSVSSAISDFTSTVSKGFSDGYNAISTFASNAISTVGGWLSDLGSAVGPVISDFASDVGTFFSNAGTAVADFATSAISKVGSWVSHLGSTATSAVTSFVGSVSSGFSSALKSVGDFVSSATEKLGSWAADAGSTIRDTLSNAWDGAKGLAGDIGSGIRKGAGKVASVAGNAWDSVTGFFGHADGGVFNREHYAKFAEGNKAEAIIPLEEATAMQPFVDAVANGLTASLGPILANINNNSQAQPLYVGTLIADDRGLKELERKMEVIRVKEGRR